MYTQEELIQIYNVRLKSNNVPIIYDLKHLKIFLNIKRNKKNLFFGKGRKYSYHKFTIPKKNGNKRTIEAPSLELKKYQLWIKNNILEKVSISKYANGFTKNKSIVQNAEKHINKQLVINIDIKNFFPSIKYNKIKRVFSYLGYTNEVSHLLTQLCTNYKNTLPQGSPASPILSNIVCIKMDKRLHNLAKKFKANYSRYADDITFSGNKNIKKIMPLVKKIIIEEGFILNKTKTRYQYNNRKQEVTGLIVNKKLAVKKSLLIELKNAIYYINKFGIDSHMKKIEIDKYFYKEHLYGLAYFINMVDKNKGKKYLNQLDKLEWIL